MLVYTVVDAPCLHWAGRRNENRSGEQKFDRQNGASYDAKDKARYAWEVYVGDVGPDRDAKLTSGRK